MPPRDALDLMDAMVVLITTSGRDEASRIADRLLDQRLIACANIIGGISSHFLWQGQRDHAEECLLIVKSRRPLFPRIRDEVRAAHSYQVPEIIALPIIDGDEPYLSWIRESVVESA